MGQPLAFFVLSGIATLLVAAWTLHNRSVLGSQHAARWFHNVSVGLSLAALLWIVAGLLGVPEGAAYVFVLRLLLFRAWIVIGVGISTAVLLGCDFIGKRKRPRSEVRQAFITSPWILKGLCFSVSISFFCTEIGKLSHDADMRQFFLQSGYTVGFMYLIMAAETAGAIGLLLSRTMLPAAIGLMLVMAGAIRTHAHNRDPLSDSLEALHLLILLACIMVVRLLRTKAGTPERVLSDLALHEHNQ